MFFSTWEGEIVKLRLVEKSKSNIEKNQTIELKKARKFENIIQLKGDFRCLSLLERDEEKMAFVAGDASQIYGFSHSGHEQIDQWTIGEQVTAMDCKNSIEGGIIFAFGTSKGSIIIRQDWEEQLVRFQSSEKKQILCVKFDLDGKYLVGCSADSHVYIFIKTNESYFENNFLSRKFDEEIPLSINFSSDQKSIIVGTDQEKHYKIELPHNSNSSNDYAKEIIEEQSITNLSKMILRYPVMQKKDKD